MNGLSRPSQVMVDKAMTVKRDKLGEVFGSASDAQMLEVRRSLAVFLEQPLPVAKRLKTALLTGLNRV